MMINDKNKIKKRGKFNIFVNPDSLYFSFSSSFFPSPFSFFFFFYLSPLTPSPPLFSPPFSPPPPSNNRNLYIYSLLNSSDPRNSTSRNGYVFKNGLFTSPFPSSSSLLDPLPLPLPLFLVFVLKSFKTFHRYASSNPLV